MLKIVLQGRLYSSKNGRSAMVTRNANGKARIFTVKSDNALRGHDDLVIQLKDARNQQKWKDMISGLEWPVILYIRYYPPDNGEFDWNNISQNLLDAMQKANYLPKDDYKHVVPLFHPTVTPDKKNPRVEFTVLPKNIIENIFPKSW